MTKNPRNSKILLHACPRCHGDLFPDSEEGGVTCLQCGRTFAVEQIATLAQAVSREPALAAAA